MIIAISECVYYSPEMFLAATTISILMKNISLTPGNYYNERQLLLMDLHDDVLLRMKLSQNLITAYQIMKRFAVSYF